jgi:hypothetical protein
MLRRAAGVMRDWPAAVRWLVAELTPFGCLFIGLLLVWARLGPVGFVWALVVSPVVTLWYLNWVQDTHPAWIFPLLAVLIPTAYIGYSIVGHVESRGRPLVVTPAYWQAFGGLLAALAVTVALAVANGERHRGRYRYIVTQWGI